MPDKITLRSIVNDNTGLILALEDTIVALYSFLFGTKPTTSDSSKSPDSLMDELLAQNERLKACLELDTELLNRLDG